MVKIWIYATGAIAVAAVALIHRWRRRRPADGVPAAGQTVSAEWLSHARGQQDDPW
jgi:hypothetical protein